MKQDGLDSRRIFLTAFTITNRQETYDQLQPYYCSNQQLFSSRAFPVAEPTTCMWNSLHTHTRSAKTFLTFKSRLKTELFTASYDS